MKRSRTARPSRSHPTVVRLSSFRPTDLKPQAVSELRATTLRKTRPENAVRPLRVRAYSPTPLQNERSKALNRSGQLALVEQGAGLLRLVLPLPPSINHQYATVQGRRVLSSAGRRFKTQVGQEVLCALAGRRPEHLWRKTLNGASLALDLRFFFVSGLRRDIDGGLKITQDAVCEALGINDNRIVEVTLRKETDVAAPRMELSLRAVTLPAPPRAST